MTVVVLYGPKGAGKSQVAEVLRAEHGIVHVDADALVLDLLARGDRPHPRDGWLAHVRDAVGSALERGLDVSVEATGAWDGDWRLADDLEAAGGTSEDRLRDAVAPLAALHEKGPGPAVVRQAVVGKRQDPRVGALRDYEAWHAGYDDPGSGLSWRLRTVQRHVDGFLDRREGPVRLLSVCAGDGRDVVGVLRGRADAARVSATLLELHPHIAQRARQAAADAGLAGTVEVREVDAGSTDAYAGLVPADLVLLVGILGNIDDVDLRRTVAAAPRLCAPQAHLIWTRGRGASIGDRDDAVRGWFADAGFSELDHATLDEGSRPAVGLVRYDGPPQALVAGQRLFTFVR